MKKFVLAGLIAVFAFAVPYQSSAQVTLISTGNSLAKDTVTNTGVKTLGTKLPGYYETVTLQFTTANLTGTQGGTVIPVASIDGITYNTCGVVFGPASSTVTATALGGVFDVPKGYLYYGVQWTGAGTMTGTITGKLISRKTTQ